MNFFQKIFNRSSQPKALASMAWLNTLSNMEDIAAIELSTQKLGESFRINTFEEEPTLTAFFSADENTHNIVERITTHFINIENISVELEERISNAVFLYHRHLFITYFSVIENYAQYHQKYIHLLLARAIRNATQMIKWRYYNYQSAPANVWLQISQLYRYAEKLSMVNAKIQPYAELEPTSLASAYIHVCMLGTLERSSLKCGQIELASNILTAWTGKISINNIYDEHQHLFFVDTASDKPAKRIRNIRATNAYRYWSFDHVNSKIELCMSLIEFNISPKQPLMKEFINNKHALTTFETLHAEWSRVDYKRQRRSEERVQASLQVTASYGFRDICNQIHQHENVKKQRDGRTYQAGKSLEERLAFASSHQGEPNVIYMDLSNDYSNLVDQSNKGLGLRINKHANEVGIGMLVGVNFPEQRHATKLGIIRSIQPIVNHELHIGIELLSHVSFSAEAQNTKDKTSKLAFNTDQHNKTDSYFGNTSFGETTNFVSSSFGTDPNNFTCIYLPKEQSISNQETLIIPKLQYNKNDVFKVNILGEDILLKFTKSIEHDANWVRVTFASEAKPQALNKAQA